MPHCQLRDVPVDHKQIVGLSQLLPGLHTGKLCEFAQREHLLQLRRALFEFALVDAVLQVGFSLVVDQEAHAGTGVNRMRHLALEPQSFLLAVCHIGLELEMQSVTQIVMQELCTFCLGFVVGSLDLGEHTLE